jgi:hypothetical protein
MGPDRSLTGIAIAAAAAALFTAGCSATGTTTGHFENPAVVKVKCYGANACKGQAECKTAMNECKGHNACKGQGFVTLDERACIERLGRA